MSSSVLTSSDIFFHVRVITGFGFGIGMSLSRLLTFAAGFIQHPDKNRISKIHFLWITFLLLQIIFYWMDYVELKVELENYKLYYIRSLLDIFCLYFMSVVLTPENIDEYGNFNNYIDSKRVFILFMFIVYELLGVVTDYYLWPASELDFPYYYNFIIIFLYALIMFAAMFFRSNKIQASILVFLIIISFAALLD